MTWTASKVTLRLLTPLHIGAGQAGNVQRARPYVSGKVLWGAFTARLTRDVAALGGDYERVGQRVADELRFSYFYPIQACEADVTVWPWGETADEFAWRYLDSYAATALDYSQNSAEDGSLHEAEFIAPTTRNELPVHLVGYVFQRAGSALSWQETLPRLQLGGERTYGWGRVAPIGIEPAAARLFGVWTLQTDGVAPILAANGGTHLLAHALATGPRAVPGVSGALEPLLGRETAQAHRHGERLAAARVCWAPGATVTPGSPCQIGPDGVWEAVGQG